MREPYHSFDVESSKIWMEGNQKMIEKIPKDQYQRMFEEQRLLIEQIPSPDPNICACAFAGPLHDNIYKFYPGESLWRVMKSRRNKHLGGLPDWIVNTMMLPICECLSFAAEQDLFHMGLCLEHILTTGSIADDGIDRLELGICGLMHVRQLPDHICADRPISRYCAPEMLAMQLVPYDAEKACVFVLGIIAYELLIGIDPFGRTPLTADYVGLDVETRGFLQACHPDERDLVQVMLHPNPKQRPKFEELIERIRLIEAQRLGLLANG